MLTVKEIEELLHALKSGKSGKSESEKKLIEFFKNENFSETVSLMLKSHQGSQVFLQLRDYGVRYNTELSSLIRAAFRISTLHVQIAQGEMNDPQKLQKIPQATYTLFKTPDGFGLIPLYDAIKYDQSCVLEFYEKTLLCRADSLIRMKQHVTAQEGAGIKEFDETTHDSLLHYLAAMGDLDMIQKIKSQSSVNLMCPDSEGDWPIHCAIDNDRVEVLAALFDPKMNVHFSKSGNNLIHKIAIFFESDYRGVEMLEILMSLGQNINHTNQYGETPIYRTFYINIEREDCRLKSREERFKMATALIKHGADLNLAASYAVAVMEECPFVIAKLGVTETYAVVNPRTGFAFFIENIVQYLNSEGSLKPSAIIQFSKNLNLDPPTIKHIPSYLLHRSVAHLKSQHNRNEVEYHHRVMQFLIQQGADLTTTNDDKKTALELADHLNLPGAKFLLHSYQEKQKKQIGKAISECTSLGSDAARSPTSLVLEYLYTSSGNFR